MRQRWACRGLVILGRAVVLVLLVGMVVSRALSDATPWSQWLFFVPPEAWIVLAWPAALLVAWLEGRRRRWGLARFGPMLAVLVATAYLAATHWRAGNVLLRRPGPTDLRLYHWNATETTDQALQDFLRRADPFGLSGGSPAVVVLANPPLRLPWAEIVSMLADRPIPASRLPSHFRRGGRLVAISGLPITDAGWTGLGLHGKTSEPDLMDHGTAMYVAVALPDGTETTIWGWDWPSDPSLPRIAMVEPSLKALARSVHVRFTPTAAGPMRRRQQAGFPRPDLVVGDFNTGRGSAAVARLLPGMRSAHAQAGIGPDYTWPRLLYLGQHDRRTRPAIGLDQAMLRPGVWRATAYRVLDLGVGTHLAQEVILTRDRPDQAPAAQPEDRPSGPPHPADPAQATEGER
ncbi:MAG: hypothetical protein KatS3mg103_0603 [Phycisphaerales bacterium]|nr:MAG: hypothetical protein KatS3mg103_0603 [Phycisphaerales bacterium]